MDKAREGAPEFVRGRISIKVDDAVATLQRYKNDKGYVTFNILRSKDGKKNYLTVDTWKPEEVTKEDIPF